MIAAAVISAAAAVQQAQAAKNAADAQAEIQRQQAERERLQAESDANDFLRDQSRKSSSARAAQGTSGVAAGEGSPLIVAEDFAGEVGLNARRIRVGGEVRATRLDQQAELTRFEGKAKQQAGFMRAGASLLSSASKWGG